MKIVITETKLRNIIRTELKNYLIQEGIGDMFSSLGTGIKSAFSTIGKDFSSTFKQAADKSAFSSIKDKFGSKIPSQFNDIEPQIKFLLPESIQNFKNLYSEIFSTNLEFNKDHVEDSIRKLERLKQILQEKVNVSKQQVKEAKNKVKGSSTSGLSSQEVALLKQLLSQAQKVQEPQNAPEKSKQDNIKAQITNLKKGIASLIPTYKEQNSSIFVASLVLLVINLFELATNMAQIPEDVKTNLDQLVDNIIKHLRNLMSAAPPTTPTT